jgi:hypothetical protein
MASYLRSMLPLAAAVAAVSLLSIASPASAAGIAVAAEAAGANALPDLRHRTPQRVRLAASRDRYVRPTRNDLDCSGAWCRRHFVLMIGIAY